MTTALKRLTAPIKERDWNYVLVIVKGKEPQMLDEKTVVTIENNHSLVFTTRSRHPFDPNSKQSFKLVSYIEIDSIAAMDFYTAGKIEPVSQLIVP